MTTARVDRVDPNGDGTETVRMHHQLKITLDVRADHSFRYEWVEIPEPHRRGVIEGAWKGEGASADLWPTEGRARLQSYVSPLAASFDGDGTTAVGGEQWFLPLVDEATGKLGDGVTVAHVPPEIPPTEIRQRVSSSPR